MIPIKIQCGCGQKYAFDVEPTDGSMGYPVLCPNCGTDGTPTANQVIAQHQALNLTSASGLRIGGEPPEVPIPVPRRFATAATQDRNSAGVKVRNKWFMPVLSGAGFCSLVLTGAAIFASSHNHKRIQKPVAPLAEEAIASLPQTVLELNAWYVEPPAGQNAATYYLQGFDALQLANMDALPVFGTGQLPPLGNAISATMKSTLAAAVKANQAASQFFAQGAKYDRCRYPVDLTLGYDALFPHCKKLDTASTLLALTATYHANAQQAEQAANDVLMGLALANSLLEEPAVLAQLPRTWSVARAVAALEQAANRTVLPASALSELSNVFQNMESSEARGEGFTRAMAGERAMSLAMLGDPQQLLRGMAVPDLKMSADRRRKITARLQTGEKLTAELEFFENAFRQLMAVRQLPFPARLTANELGRQLLAEAQDKKLFVLDLVLPSLGRRTGVEAECLAQLRLGWTAVALEKFRAAHDEQYPAALLELTPDYLPATPADPFDGLPLRYLKKGGGYTLYSIGPDMKDNSGVRKSGNDGDIVFAVVTPPSSTKNHQTPHAE